MDIQNQKKEIYQVPSPQSVMLARQALIEWERNGTVSVICPKCQKHPEVTTIVNYPPLIEVGACNYPVIKLVKSQ